MVDIGLVRLGDRGRDSGCLPNDYVLRLHAQGRIGDMAGGGEGRGVRNYRWKLLDGSDGR
jgi:hypothetical protein